MHQPHGTSQQLVKEHNESAVLELLRQFGELSRTEIGRMLHLSTPTVSSLLESLAERRLVLPTGPGPSSGGRKPMIFKFNPDAAVVIGVDCGASKISAGLTNLAGKVLHRLTITRADGAPDPVDRLLEAVERVRSYAPPGIPVEGVGVGVPGVVDRQRGIVTLAPGLGWDNLELGPCLERRLGLPVHLENDVNTILLGEHRFGVAQGKQDVLCVAVGTGIGASMLIGGRLFRGANGAAGEVGYTRFQPGDLVGSAGGYGHLERICAGPGIAARARQALMEAANLTAPTEEMERLTAQEVCAAAAAGDPICGHVVQETAHMLGLAVGNMVCLLNPELVVLTGGVIRAGEVLLEPMRQAISRFVPYDAPLVASQLWDEAGILGAAALVLDSLRLGSGSARAGR